MLQEIIIGITIILVMYFTYMILSYYKVFEGTSLSGLKSADETETIQGTLYNPSNLNVNNYGFIIWFYVNDWKLNYDKNRYILSRTLGDGSDGDNDDISAYFASSTTNLIIQYSTNGDTLITNCMIENIPSQKWVCLGVSKYNNTFDIYIDGKLANTCSSTSIDVAGSQNSFILHGSDNGANATGFNGYTKNFRFYTKELDPAKVFDVYKYGSSGNIFDNILGNYKMRMSLLKNEEEIAGVGLG